MHNGFSFGGRRGCTIRLFVAISGLGGLLSGCAVDPAAISEASLSKEQAVARRAGERWALLVAGDLDRAYPFISPGTRQVYSLSAYKATVNPRLWKGAKVVGVECSSEESCRARVLIRYQINMRIRGAVEGEQEINEAWLRINSQWWFVPDRFEGRVGQ